MKSYKKTNRYTITIFIAIGIIIAIGIFTAFYKFVKYADSRSTVTNKMPNEFKNLFVQKDSIFSDIETHIIYKNQRYPVSDFLYDHKYFITVTRLNTLYDFNVLPPIKIQIGETVKNYYGRFDGFDIPGGELEYRPHGLIASDFFLTLYGDSIRQISRTDHLVGYYFLMKKYSLKYERDGLVDLYLETDNSQLNPPTILLFLNFQKKVYLIYIISHDPLGKLNPGIIDQIIKNR